MCTGEEISERGSLRSASAFRRRLEKSQLRAIIQRQHQRKVACSVYLGINDPLPDRLLDLERQLRSPVGPITSEGVEQRCSRVFAQNAHPIDDHPALDGALTPEIDNALIDSAIRAL